MVDEVKQLLLTFAKFEKDGTLPNTIHGNDVSNRDTSRCAAVVCASSARNLRWKCKPAKSNNPKLFDTPVDEMAARIREVLDKHR